MLSILYFVFSSICIYHSIILTTFFPQVILQLCNFNIAVKKKHYTIYFSNHLFPNRGIISLIQKELF